jgi:hypothetical protein
MPSSVMGALEVEHVLDGLKMYNWCIEGWDLSRFFSVF